MPEREDWFSADRPIAKLADDQLGRSSFAEALATAIRGWKGRDSLVIALYGPWGTGKSSIKNMTLDALRSRICKDAPTVTEFNPWQFANHEQLAEAFFDQIGVALGRGTTGSQKDKRRLLRRWKRYEAYLTAGAGLIEHSRSLLIMCLIFAAAVLGIAAAQIRPLAWIVVGVLIAFAAVLRWSSKFAFFVRSLIEPGVEIGRKGLEEVKAELSETLRCMTGPLLVIIDDVDRLIPSELQQLFQLIKVNADFPNLVYLIMFDRIVVEKNIEKVLAVTGRDYLEKIVQVGFDVPTIDRERLNRILFEGLDRVLRESGASNRFEKHRWGNLFVGALQQDFKTLRDVNRFLSTLSFHVSLFRSESSFEVNPVDLIGLEVLRVFHPEVYRSIAANKTLFTSTLQRDQRSKERHEALSMIIDEAPEYTRPAVREIVKQLFPTVESAFGGNSYGAGFEETWYRELRVCSEDVFERYFHLAIAENDISQAALDRILNSTGKREHLRAEFLALKSQGLLPTALDRLEAYKEKLPLEHGESLVTALFDVCDDLGRERAGMFEISPMMHADRIIYWYLRREADAARRLKVLETAIQETYGISLPIDFVSLESAKAAEEGKRNNALVDDVGAHILQGLCVNKIATAAAAGRIAKLPGLPSILYRWKEWAGDTDPKAYVQELVKSREGAVAFLKAFLVRSTSHGMGDYVAREHWYISLKSIEDFVPWESIESTLNDVSLEGSENDDATAIEAFRRATHRRRQGKPDFGVGMNMDDED